MAEGVVSALLPVLFQKLTSEALKNIARYKGIDAEIEKLHGSLTQIQDVLAEASCKEITSQTVKRWLNNLKHLAYSIDDVLDDLAKHAMEKEFASQSKAINSKVRKLIPNCCTNFSKYTKMLGKLDSINAKLQELLKEKADLGLSVINAPNPRNYNENRRFQSSVFDSSRIVGRQAEKEALVQQLQKEDGSSHQKFGIVPILGMGGVGKTTLARLLYDDQWVNEHFEIKGWVCISDDFNIFGRTKDIFKSVGGKLKKKHEDFNILQEALRDYLSGKRFLLVLDDVCCESCQDWETLVTPLFTCASGSKIIITTRKDQLLKQLECDPQKQLLSLLEEDALSLLAFHALGETNFDSHLLLKPHAEGIVKNCGGLPLALIALGRSLRSKKDEVEHWEKVSNSEIWRLKDVHGILPALRLSYHELSAPLKLVFAYCSLFPKGFVFDKEELILLWMAEGLLHQLTCHSTVESLGREYFEELLSRSFFQYAPNNESLFVMHNLMNDLATHVAGDFFVRFDIEVKKDAKEEMLEKYHHMSFVSEEYVTYKQFEAFERFKSLRTFLAMSVGVVESWKKFNLSNKIVVDLLNKLPLLRVLSLSNFNISEIPKSIDNLGHLRYLNLSRTEIKNLPENVCSLYNLETLILFGCLSLAKLPNSILTLTKLRHLDIRKTPCLNQMPLGISELKNLQTLSKIIIGGESGFEITKLKDFVDLCGELSIVGLEKLQNAIDARVANFPQKRLSKLKVVWSDMWDDSRNERLEKDVLNELKPHNNKLIKLKIRSYGGSEFPKWVGDPLFDHLKHVSLSGCKRCTSLPPLAQLRSLKELFIKDLDGVEAVGMEVLGTCHAFPSLEILTFNRMHKWNQWSVNNGRDVFPCLKQLVIKDCPKLVEVKCEGLPPSLHVLNIDLCDGGVLRKLVEVASSVTKLRISSILGLNDEVWKGVIGHLRAVEELSIENCNEIKYMWESEAVASSFLVNIRDLNVSWCNNLVNLGEKENDKDCNLSIASLRTLKVSSCQKMNHCNCPDSIETLIVRSCCSITSISLPTGGGGGLKSLVIQDCKYLSERVLGGQNNNNRMLLEKVTLSDWPNLKSINLNCLVHLTKLGIHLCTGLELPNLSYLTSLKHLYIQNCPKMDVCVLWPPNLQILEIGRLKKPISQWGSPNFPNSLVDLSLYDGDGVRSFSQLSNLLPSSLTSLSLYNFENLESFSMELQHLQSLFFVGCYNLHQMSHPQHPDNSLQHLTFCKCPKMDYLPTQLLPSLLSLNIGIFCPNLRERYNKSSGNYWPLISHIPHINIEPA